jgi:hypothetical protein
MVAALIGTVYFLTRSSRNLEHSDLASTGEGEGLEDLWLVSFKDAGSNTVIGAALTAEQDHGSAAQHFSISLVLCCLFPGYHMLSCSNSGSTAKGILPDLVELA